MQLDKVAVVLRPRQGWEAVDLGFRMAAHWAAPLWRVWAAVYLPLALALSLALRAQPWLAALLLWWMKPVADRWLLHVLGRAVFGEVPTLGATLAAWREVLSPGLAWSLLARLWDYARSFTLPVTQLERQRGRAAAARRRLLKQRAGAHALGLTFVCACFELVVLYGLYALAQLFGTDLQWARDGRGDLWSHLATATDWWTWRDTAAYVTAISLIEPFYVAGGFALYLNRRVLLEGWDVEVSLRRMAERRVAQRARAGLLILLAAGALACPPLRALPAVAAVAAAGADAVAQTLAADAGEDAGEDAAGSEGAPDAAAPAAADAARDTGMCPAPYAPQETPVQRAAREVLADAAFGSARSERRWVAIPRAGTAAPRRSDGATLGKLATLLAEVLRVVAWVALAALVVVGLGLLVRHWPGRSAPAGRAAAPAQLFGLAIHPDSLPPDIPAAARALLAAGRRREALSLLYRGALSHVVHERGLVVRRGATEGDVLTLAQRALPAAAADYFTALLPVWSEAAYAARLPAPERIEALCAQHAGAMPRAAAGGAA